MTTSIQIQKTKGHFVSLAFLLTVLWLLLSATSNSQSWSALGGGTNWEYSLCVYNNELYAGEQGGSGGHGLKKFDGTNWNDLGGINGTVNAMVVYNGSLIVGGSFSLAGGLDVLNIAQWDGTTWSDVGGGPDNIVAALTVYNGDLIVGGYFTTVEGINANHIAKYGSGGWQPLGAGTNSQVMALTTYNNKLVAGGFFTTAGGTSAGHIALWDGASWSPIGSGTNSIVYAVNSGNGKLYAGGLFSAAGGISAQGIASWDGTAWSNLGSGCGSGMYPYVFGIIPFGGNVYAGGLYTIAGGQTVNGIAKWDGTNWISMGTGFSSGGSNVFGAFAMTIFNNKLVAGGIFNSVDGVNAGNVAQWDGLIMTGVSGNNSNTPKGFSLSQNYPNPFNPSTTIKFSVNKQENVKLTVVNELGQIVTELANKQYAPGSYEVKWDASKQGSGVYFYTISTPSFSETKKMVLSK